MCAFLLRYSPSLDTFLSYVFPCSINVVWFSETPIIVLNMAVPVTNHILHIRPLFIIFVLLCLLQTEIFNDFTDFIKWLRKQQPIFKYVSEVFPFYSYFFPQLYLFSLFHLLEVIILLSGPRSYLKSFMGHFKNMLSYSGKSQVVLNLSIFKR